VLTVGQDQALVERSNGELLLVCADSVMTDFSLRRVLWIGSDWPPRSRRYLSNRLDDPRAPDAWPPEQGVTLASLSRRERHNGGEVKPEAVQGLKRKWGSL